MNSRAYRYSARAFLLSVIATIILTTVAVAQSGRNVWNFDRDAGGKMPVGFSSALTGEGAAGQWAVIQDASAPSPPNVFAQTSADPTDYRFPLAIADDTNYGDLALSVKFKTISGKVDQGAGLVFRLKDKDNYYIVRANALEGNLRLYHVIKGRRVQFAGANFSVTPNVWHEIKVEARKNAFACFYDGQPKFTAQDDTFKGPGKIGVWTKADSVIHFDDLTVEDLGGSDRNSAMRGKIEAQRLVDNLIASHPGLVRVGMHLTPPGQSDNTIVACNVAERIGRKSDPEDVKAMQTEKPIVLREAGNFDVTLPLHTASGKVIGALGLTFKPEANEGESVAVERAKRMASELEAHIPSKAKLFDPME